MATIGVGFRWLDVLEKEFDKACVELNTSLSELEAEEPETVVSARQKIATLTSCFAQLTHKSLTIFQNSAKLEAELVDMRAELVQARAVSAGALQDGGDAPGNVLEVARARSEAAQLARENAALRETVLALHSELFGARLATKYLDKELAGRIQQLQLLGRDMRSELRDSLWAQVEAEILLQRHKTLVRVCRGLSPRPPPPPAPARAAERSRPRTVRVRRSPHLGLGISVTGGREHGVPILISELEEGGPAALTGELCVGDAILAINDVDLTQACHKEAVHALQSVKGDCALCVQFIATDDDDRLSEDNYRFPLYPEDGEVFEREQDGSGATPTAPRTPDYNNRDDCEAGSDSECRSPVHRYPDYGGVNNHAILDMDDDSIKIQASVEPTAAECRGSWGESPGGGGGGGRGARALARGAYASLDQSSESPASTPVHRRARVRSHNKRHYRALDTGNDSSDDKQEEQARSAPSPREEARAAAGAPQPLGAARPQPAPAPPPGRPRGDGRQRGGNGPKGFRIGSARRVTEPPPPLTNGDVERAHGKLPARSHLPPSQPPPSHQPPSQPPPSHQLPSQPPPSHQPPSQPPLSHQPPSQPTPSHQPPSSQPPPSHQTPSQPPPSQPPPSHQPPSQPPPSQPTLPYLAPSHQTPSHLAPSHLPPSQPLPLLAGDGDPDFGTPV